LDEPQVDDIQGAGDDAGEEDGQPERLNLEVEIASPSACERHVTVTVSREDVDRYLDEAYSELMATASVPGFRVGRAPRKLVENRYKDEIGEKIKGSLLMDSLSQISEEQSFTAISEPELNLDAIEVPDEGPMVFEFDIEVRPEFDLPQWKGLKIERPVREFSDADVDQHLEQMLARYGQLVPHDGPAALGDFVTVNLRTKHDGQQVATEEELTFRVRPQLSFLDGRLDDFGTLIEGAQAGEKRTGSLQLTADAPNEELRGKKVELEFDVLDVKKLKLPELSAEFLQEMGNFESEEKLREAIRANLQRQLEYEQQRKARQQITAELTKKADWDLPPGLLKRQSVRELERAVMELRRAGFSESEIRARQNEIRQNSAASTARALKEHFILERIAEEEKIEAQEGDFEQEIFLIALQSGESPRRVRAQLEKRGLMDVLQNQIVERKVLELVQSEAKFKDLPFEPSKMDAEALSIAAGGGGSESIPAAEAEAPAQDNA
jgi:trigger factor